MDNPRLGWGNRQVDDEHHAQIHDILTCMACGHEVEMGYWDCTGTYHVLEPEILTEELHIHEGEHLVG